MIRKMRENRPQNTVAMIVMDGLKMVDQPTGIRKLIIIDEAEKFTAGLLDRFVSRQGDILFGLDIIFHFNVRRSGSPFNNRPRGFERIVINNHDREIEQVFGFLFCQFPQKAREHLRPAERAEAYRNMGFGRHEINPSPNQDRENAPAYPPNGWIFMIKFDIVFQRLSI